MDSKPVFRAYQSDTALHPQIPSSSNEPHYNHALLYTAKSEPTISLSRKSHPLLVEDNNPPHYNTLFLAAETLENIVAEGSLMGNVVKRQATGLVGDTVLRIVYGTMKYLPYIDKILVKTQFLVYNTQFLGSLCLVKVMLYELMKHNFEFRNYSFSGAESREGALDREDMMRKGEVQELLDAFMEHQIKLAAAFARIRISTRAIGDSNLEKMENILPLDVREKETKAVEMPKTLRINYNLTSMEKLVAGFEEYGFKFSPSQIPPAENDVMYLDEDFPDLVIVPSVYFADLKSKPLVTDGHLIFQDKASLYAPRHLISILCGKKGEIIDARSGCGTRASYLSILTSQKIYAFEARPTRLESLRAHLSLNCAENVNIVPHAFTTSQTRDYPDVVAILVEPPSSGSAVMDRLGFLLQEEEFPSQTFTQKDLLSLQRTQISHMKHAFSFPGVNHIVYVTRSTSHVENTDVVNAVLDRFGVDWELRCVMPDKVQAYENDMLEECLYIKPSDEQGNGVFVAHFQRKSVRVEEAAEQKAIEEVAMAAEDSTIRDKEDDDVKKKKKKRTIPGSRPARPLGLTRAQMKTIKRLTVKTSLMRVRKEESVADVNEESSASSSSSDGDDPVRQSRKTLSERKSRIKDRTKLQLSNSESALTLAGIGLKRFYAPRFAAVKRMQLDQPGPASRRMPAERDLWSYPVCVYNLIQVRFPTQALGSRYISAALAPVAY